MPTPKRRGSEGSGKAQERLAFGTSLSTWFSLPYARSPGWLFSRQKMVQFGIILDPYVKLPISSTLFNNNFYPSLTLIVPPLLNLPFACSSSRPRSKLFSFEDPTEKVEHPRSVRVIYLLYFFTPNDTPWLTKKLPMPPRLSKRLK